VGWKKKLWDEMWVQMDDMAGQLATVESRAKEAADEAAKVHQQLDALGVKLIEFAEGKKPCSGQS